MQLSLTVRKARATSLSCVFTPRLGRKPMPRWGSREVCWERYSKRDEVYS